MREVKNIDWNYHESLIDLSEIDQTENSYNNEEHTISFEWNGYWIKAEINYSLVLDRNIEEDLGLNDVWVTGAEIHIKKMYDENEDDFQLEIKELIELQNQLTIDLLNEY